MSAGVFFDTNILVYVFDDRNPSKQAAARELVKTHSLVVSTQVLGEFYVTTTRKLSVPLPATAAAEAVNYLLAQTVVPLTGPLVAQAISTSQRYQLSYWDALIIEAAATAGCTTLLTEDLTDGQVIRGVRVENPFKAA
ncbi:MAG: PIN domain-containing protein [Propionibacteriaceae bacterium]|jgi:predicted nucleic acid-binding protein|nr:PIN domain-containing protein [Propionibacteriaceae bacterium]